MLNELDSLVERLIYERSPAERKRIALKISEFGEDAIDPLLQAIDRTWETIDIDTDMFIFDALRYTYQNVGLRPFERVLLDKSNSFRKYLPNMLAGFKENDAIEVLGKALKNEDEAIYQTRLIAGLGQTDSKKAIPILRQYENYENLEVSYLAKFGIAMIERKELPAKPAELERGD
ncbi:hypothetical protein C5S32_02885 [ANME-1 cluster archaeon GoMg1]|nr:hypothetical protein [ANME-1 cluster archaeon GoMg1]